MGRTFPHVKIDEATDGLITELVHSGNFADKGTVIRVAVKHFVTCKSKDALDSGGSITSLLDGLDAWMKRVKPAIKKEEGGRS
jgi:hypothetical protein